jgi:hypothetical protein
MTPASTLPNLVSDISNYSYTNALADSRGVRLISRITAFLVLLLAIAAFVMSFDALHSLAIESGAIAPQFGYLFPLAVDGAIIVFSIGALRASLCAESTRVPMLLVVAVTSLSVIFNIAHAPFGLLSCVMAATPPLLLFLAFESLMRQLSSEFRRRSAVASLEELKHQHSEALDRLEALQAKEQKLSGRVDELTQEKKQARTSRQGSATTEAERQARVARVQELKLNGASNAEIAKELSVSKATVRRDVSEPEKLAA